MNAITGNVNNFLQSYNTYRKVCSGLNYNVVLPRYDRYNIDLDLHRNWSLDSGKHGHHLPIDSMYYNLNIYKLIKHVGK